MSERHVTIRIGASTLHNLYRAVVDASRGALADGASAADVAQLLDCPIEDAMALCEAASDLAEEQALADGADSPDVYIGKYGHIVRKPKD